MNELLDLYADLLLPYMRIRREMPFPTEPERDETDGEHAFSLAFLAMMMNDRLDLGLDRGLVAQYALVHDLVEVHAGDTSVLADEDAHQTKVEREHAAFLLLKRQFAETAPWLIKLIDQYESRADEESKFVYAADKMMGAFARLAGDGARWAEAFPEPDGATYHKAVDRLRQKVEAYPPLVELFETVHNELEANRADYLEQSKYE